MGGVYAARGGTTSRALGPTTARPLLGRRVRSDLIAPNLQGLGSCVCAPLGLRG